MDEKEKNRSYEKEKKIESESEGESENAKQEEEEQTLRRAKIQKIKELIQRGEYQISPEEIAEKMLEFFKKNKD